VRWLRWWLELERARRALYRARGPLALALAERALERVRMNGPR